MPPGSADPFQPNGDVDPVAKKIAAGSNDYVTKIDPDAQLEAMAARSETILYLNRASHGGQWTGELGECAIARCLDKSSFVAGEAWLDQFSLEPLEPGVGGFLGALHQRRVTDHVGSQDRR